MVREAKRPRVEAQPFDGFLMKLPRCHLPEQIWAWARQKFVRFRVRNTDNFTIVGAFGFKQPYGRSWAKFQSSVLMNFKNWGFQRDNRYDHDWFSPAPSVKLYLKAFRRPIRAGWQGIRQKLQKPKSEAKKLKERRRVLNGGAIRAGRASLGDRLAAKEAFGAFAAVLEEKQEARREKRARFNLQRFGQERVPHAQYTSRELDFCESWQEVARQRVPPRSLAEMKERACLERICLEQCRVRSQPVG